MNSRKRFYLPLHHATHVLSCIAIQADSLAKLESGYKETTANNAHKITVLREQYEKELKEKELQIHTMAEELQHLDDAQASAAAAVERRLKEKDDIIAALRQHLPSIDVNAADANSQKPDSFPKESSSSKSLMPQLVSSTTKRKEAEEVSDSSVPSYPKRPSRKSISSIKPHSRTDDHSSTSISTSNDSDSTYTGDSSLVSKAQKRSHPRTKKPKVRGSVDMNASSDPNKCSSRQQQSKFGSLSLVHNLDQEDDLFHEVSADPLRASIPQQSSTRKQNDSLSNSGPMDPPHTPAPDLGQSIFDFPGSIQSRTQKQPTSLGRRKLLPLESKQPLSASNSKSIHNPNAFVHTVNATLSTRGKTMKKEGPSGPSLVQELSTVETSAKSKSSQGSKQSKKAMLTSTYGGSIFSNVTVSKPNLKDTSQSVIPHSDMLFDTFRGELNDLFSSNVFHFP